MTNRTTSTPIWNFPPAPTGQTLMTKEDALTRIRQTNQQTVFNVCNTIINSLLINGGEWVQEQFESNGLPPYNPLGNRKIAPLVQLKLVSLGYTVKIEDFTTMQTQYKPTGEEYNVELKGKRFSISADEVEQTPEPKKTNKKAPRNT